VAELVRASEAVPKYDPVARQLSWCGGVVKTPHREAACQETVLLAFEVAGWAALLDDPLAVERGVNAKARLRETVESYNRRVLAGTVQFHADGTGRGVRWDAVEAG
jgi:hypothetical protein